MENTCISNRRPFDTKNGAEEVTIHLDAWDRLRIVTASGAEFTIQDDLKGQPEICVLDGKPTIYT